MKIPKNSFDKYQIIIVCYHGSPEIITPFYLSILVTSVSF